MEKKIVNLETDEVTIETLTEEELKNWHAKKQANELKYADFLAKQSAKKELLQKLGITEDDVKILLS